MQIFNRIFLSHKVVIIFFFIFEYSILFAHQKDLPTKNIETDTVIAENDTSALDTSTALRSQTKEPDQLESPIYYWAENISLSRTQNRIYLENNAKIVYENMTLTAAKIMIDQDNQYLFAEGVIDTIDSLGNPIYKGEPVFKEEGEKPMYGNTLYYDYKTKRGKISEGKTQMPPGYYRGTDIHKISDKTLLVRDGYFTSCEYIDNPHFYFRSTKMRVLVRDKVVAKPVYFYIADIPLMAIPFGVFPNKRGRRSGLLIPSYGQNKFGGRYLRNLGYYWAPNDYIDATLLTTFYDKLGFTYETNLSYVLRYVLSGRVSGTYFPRDPNTGKKRERWSFAINHRQKIDPTMSLNISGKFQSDKTFQKQYNQNINERLNQIITSNLSLNKRFKGTKNSMSLSMSRTENLRNGNLNYTFPSLSFSRSQTSIYETVTGKSARQQKAWYKDIYFSYNSRLLNQGDKKLQNDSSFVTSERHGINHNLSFNAPQKVLKYFNLVPSLNYRETWVDEVTEANLDPETNKIVEKQVKKFAARRTFNSSLKLKTTIYGLMEPKLGNLQFIRHKIDPQISLTYTPDFSSTFYGYYNTIRDTTGKINKIDKFKKNPFGGTPTRESRLLNYSVNNLFQGKIVDNTEEKKIDLFTLNFSGGYDFKADSLNMRDLSSSLRSKPIRRVSLSVNSVHSFYSTGPGGTGVVNRFLLTEGSLPRLKNVSANMQFSLSEKDFILTPRDEETEEATEQDDISEEGILETDDEREVEFDDDIRNQKSLSGSGFSFNTNINLNYKYNRTNINNPDERIDLNLNTNLKLSKKWKISWQLRYDIEDDLITYQSFNIERDLHCWVMTFNWQPTFGYYNLQINIRSSVLRDIKVTKRPAGRVAF